MFEIGKQLCIATILGILSPGFFMITGCDQTTAPLVDVMVTDKTKPIPAAGEMEKDNAPESTIAPTVVEVGWYSDQQLTKPITGSVYPGDTIYTKVVFSEPMEFKAANDITARPILYYQINNTLLPYRIIPRGTSDENFQSEDAKPLHTGTDAYICQYIVREEDIGEFTSAVDKLSADETGNSLAAFYLHKMKLQIQPKDATSPTVLSITHYRDGSQEPIEMYEAVQGGTIINTEIVFSEPMLINSRDNINPDINYITGPKRGQYEIFQSGRSHRSGICKPLTADGTAFLCKQRVSKGVFFVTVGTGSTDLAGNPLVEAVRSRPIVVTSQQPTNNTFTLKRKRYPGYNPSADLQHVLDFHSSVQLPFFEASVRAVEVIDWTYREVWTVYPDNADSRSDARKRVLAKFGLTQGLTGELARIYFDLAAGYSGEDVEPHAKYWFTVEYLRLKLQYPRENALELLNHFRSSVEKDYIVGTTNPND